MEDLKVVLRIMRELAESRKIQDKELFDMISKSEARVNQVNSMVKELTKASMSVHEVVSNLSNTYIRHIDQVCAHRDRLQAHNDRLLEIVARLEDELRSERACKEQLMDKILTLAYKGNGTNVNVN